MQASPQPALNAPEVVLEDGVFRPSAALRTSEAAIAAVRAGVQPAANGIALCDANALLEPGYLAMETGYCRLDDGLLYVAAHTPMPGVTGEMIDFWFAWHGEDSARYQLWHPRDHIAAQWQRPVSFAGGNRHDWQALYRGNVSDVDEHIGSERMKLSIAFTDPSVYLDTSRFEVSGTDTVICARTHARRERMAAGHIVHQIRRTTDGVEMRSRFWLADLDPLAPAARAMAPLLRPVLNTRRVRRAVIPTRLGRDLVLHCAEEMAHLAEFLPELFRRVVVRTR